MVAATGDNLLRPLVPDSWWPALTVLIGLLFLPETFRRTLED
jgi:hypothetical protein